MLNAISWGTLMPIGAMTARYMKVFKSADPAWFYLHVACQCCAYVIGVAGWAIGLALGNNTGIHTYSHGKIGMTLFILGTLQVPLTHLSLLSNNTMYFPFLVLQIEKNSVGWDVD